jgi:hypothetical protein
MLLKLNQVSFQEQRGHAVLHMYNLHTFPYFFMSEKGLQQQIDHLDRRAYAVDAVPALSSRQTPERPGGSLRCLVMGHCSRWELRPFAAGKLDLPSWHHFNPCRAQLWALPRLCDRFCVHASTLCAMCQCTLICTLVAHTRVPCLQPARLQDICEFGSRLDREDAP